MPRVVQRAGHRVVPLVASVLEQHLLVDATSAGWGLECVDPKIVGPFPSTGFIIDLGGRYETGTTRKKSTCRSARTTRSSRARRTKGSRRFYPRRQQFMFRVKVPSDWGKKDLVWTIAAHGKTEKAYGSLWPVWEIDRKHVSAEPRRSGRARRAR
jgi:hypothetical protein